VVQRVLIIGIPGAGKSTFARALAARTGLPLIHLDQEFWQPGWRPTPKVQWEAHLATLVQRPAWVMDGNFDRSLPIRLPRADTVILFDIPRHRALWRVGQRIARSYGRVRPDMAPGCPERLDGAFVRYIWNFHGRDRRNIQVQLDAHGVRPVVLGSDADSAAFLAHIPAKSV
jgi:adenylate kinase family enzyme